MKKDSLIKQSATTLFYQQGWQLTSVTEICRLAGVSRVTFYKHFPTKQALVKRIFEEQKNKIRDEFERLLSDGADLATVLRRMLEMQRESMATLYSAPVLWDLNHHQDEELQHFFQQMEQEKYRYMRYFFGTLQQRHLIRQDFPVILIDLFIRKIDEVLRAPNLQQHYADQEQQLFKDVLQLFMHGIASQEHIDRG